MCGSIVDSVIVGGVIYIYIYIYKYVNINIQNVCICPPCTDSKPVNTIINHLHGERHNARPTNRPCARARSAAQRNDKQDVGWGG